MKKWVKIALISLIIILVIVAVFLILIYYNKKCSDGVCFDSALTNCNKANFISETKDSTWQYQIKGKSLACFFSKKYCKTCEVNVELLQIKKGSVDTEKLQGLAMDCSLDFGYVGNPQDNLERCSGKLKEQMQDLIIKRMHAYILQNVGKIGEELSKVV